LGFPFIFSIVAAVLFTGLVSYFLGKLTLGLKGDYFLIATLGFGESVRVILEYASSITGGARGLPGIPTHTTLPVVIASVVFAIVIASNFLRSKYGRNLMAIREQEIAAEAVGIDTARYKIMSFVMSAVFAGWAGALYAHYLSFISPVMFNLDKSAELTITVVIGGLGSITGSVLATILLTALPELFRDASVYRMLLYGLAVVLIITLRPAGLFGYREFSFSGLRSWVTGLFKSKSAAEGS
jgi:branched-chain amino acid transport system permease protein